jgi:hypothetical protein
MTLSWASESHQILPRPTYGQVGYLERAACKQWKWRKTEQKWVGKIFSSKDKRKLIKENRLKRQRWVEWITCWVNWRRQCRKNEFTLKESFCILAAEISLTGDISLKSQSKCMWAILLLFQFHRKKDLCMEGQNSWWIVDNLSLGNLIA